jgi:hypothetical protein
LASIAQLIADIENRRPDVMAWAPEISITGRREALGGAGKGWLITDSRASRFYGRLTGRLGAGPAPAAEGDPLPSAAGSSPAAGAFPGVPAAGSPREVPGDIGAAGGDAT